MTDEELKAIEAKIKAGEGDQADDLADFSSDCEDLIAEVRRLRETEKSHAARREHLLSTLESHRESNKRWLDHEDEKERRLYLALLDYFDGDAEVSDLAVATYDEVMGFKLL